MKFGVISFLLLCTFASSQKPKILALHGGGGTGVGFSGSSGMRSIEDAMPDYEFVYPDAAYGNSGSFLWISDPPGGKGQPTTDPAFSDESIEVLDDIVENEGPFVGIIGYSQGSAYVPVYLSRVPANTFQFSAMFCGYKTETHQGILDVVNEQSPFGGIRGLIWMGKRDYVIPNSLSRDQATLFTDPTIIVSSTGGHTVPDSSDPTFNEVVSFLTQAAGSRPPSNAPVPTTSTPSTAPTISLLPTSSQSPSKSPTVSSPNFYIGKIKKKLEWKSKKWTGFVQLFTMVNGEEHTKKVKLVAKISDGKKNKQIKCKKTKKKGVCTLKLPNISWKAESIELSLVKVISSLYDESLNIDVEEGCPVFSEQCPSITINQPEYDGKESKDDEEPKSKD